MAMDNRVWSLFRQAKKVRLDSHTVTRSVMDDHVAEEMVERADRYKQVVETRPVIEGDDAKKREYVPHWDDLCHDLFVSYHGDDDPSVLPQDQIKLSREANRRVMQKVVGTDDHGQARRMTKGDPIASAFATMSMQEKLTELLQGEMSDTAQQAQQAEKLENKVENSQDAIDQIREQIAQQGGEATDEQKQEMRNAAEKKAGAAKQLAKIAQQMQDTPISNAVATELNKAAKEGHDAAKTVAALPGMGKSAGEKLKPDDALHMAELFHKSDVLRKAAEILGRLLRDMRFKRARRITGGNEEVVDVTTGNDIPLLLASELMALRHPLLKRNFYRSYHEKTLLQYELQGTTEVGFGPIAIVKDSSGSMKKNQKHVWAVAVTLALMAVAHREKRDVIVVDYSTSVADWRFPYKETLDPAKVVEMASHFFGGGTDTDLAMTHTLKQMEDDKFNRADIVLISDGQDSYGKRSVEITSELETKGIRCHGIQIGGAVSGYLAQMCEEAMPAYDLAGPNKATDMLATAVG